MLLCSSMQNSILLYSNVILEYKYFLIFTQIKELNPSLYTSSCTFNKVKNVNTFATFNYQTITFKTTMASHSDQTVVANSPPVSPYQLFYRIAQLTHTGAHTE